MSEARFRVIRGQSRLPRSIRDTWPTSVPWSFVETFRERAESNHSQTLERLNERGGLGPDELWLAAHDRKLFSKDRPSEEECGQWLVDEMRRIGDSK